MKQASEQGHTDAMFSLAMYFRGDGSTEQQKDSEEMLYYMKMAADRGHCKSQRMLGFAHRNGDGVQRNLILARQYLTLAAEQGDKAARFELETLEEEEAEEKARAEADRVRLSQLDPTDVDELYLTAVRYKEGEGVAKDNKEAVRYFRLAADQGHARALYFLANSYRDGDGVAQDLVEAARLFQLSAEQNYPEAEYELAFCYYSGKVVSLLGVYFFSALF